MAEIWLATDEQSGTCALRRIRNSSLFNFTAQRRFLHGCNVLSRIHDHDDIIGYLEHGKMEGTLYLLMEYVEASNLKELYAQHDPVLLENVAQILIDTAEGSNTSTRAASCTWISSPRTSLSPATPTCG